MTSRNIRLFAGVALLELAWLVAVAAAFPSDSGMAMLIYGLVANGLLLSASAEARNGK